MLDLIAMLTFTAVFVVQIIVLVGLTPSRRTTKAWLFALASAWLAVIVAIASQGGFGPRVTDGVPAVAYAFLPAVLLGLATWIFIPAFRTFDRAERLPPDLRKIDRARHG